VCKQPVSLPATLKQVILQECLDFI